MNREFHRFRLTYRHSITCDTQQDAEARIANTGATGGLVGKREIVVRYVSFAICPERERSSSRVDLGSKSANPTPPSACEAQQQKRSKSTRGINNPLLKRIAQTDLGQVAQSWQNLCEASGGPRDPNNDPCVVLAGINGINALLAGADACAQQDNADAMVDFAKLP